jgi:TolB-like protein/tetratricopeptide (TPR) repeat protein
MQDHSPAVEPSREQAERALEKILVSRVFQGSERLSRFLRFVVEHAVRGETAPLKEYVIGVQVFDRGESFDTRLDTIVRVEARRLRAKLREYYESEGRDDSTIIEFSSKGYAARFRRREPLQTTASKWPKRYVLAVVGVVVVATVVMVWRFNLGRRTDRRIPIVVLPFVNMSGEPEYEYLSDGFTEEISSTLASVPELHVVARTSAFAFKGRGDDVRRIGRELGVAVALEGSVRKAGQRIRVTAQLIDATDGMHMWSKTYERDFSSLFVIQDEITRAIVDALRIRLAPGLQRRLARSETTSVPAYDLYLKGRHSWHKGTPPDVKNSIAYMEQAIALDTKYAAAYAGLADAYILWANFELEPPWDTLTKARRAAHTAVELDPDSAEARYVLGAVLAVADWNWSAAEREFLRALELKSSLASAHMAYSVLCLSTVGRFDEAIYHLRVALELDPRSLMLRTALGQTYVFAGRADAGIEQLREVQILDAGFVWNDLTLAWAYLARAEYVNALQLLERIADSAQEIPNHAGLIGYTHARLGNRRQAEATLHRLRERSTGTWIPPVEVAGIYNGLGDRDEALNWLERALEQRSIMSAIIVDDPRFRDLWSHPRFSALVKRLNLVRSR